MTLDLIIQFEGRDIFEKAVEAGSLFLCSQRFLPRVIKEVSVARFQLVGRVYRVEPIEMFKYVYDPVVGTNSIYEY